MTSTVAEDLTITPPSGSGISLNDTSLEKHLETGQQEYLCTARELFKQDGSTEYTDLELLKWLQACQNHRGRALSALSDSLTFRNQHLNPLYKTLPPPPETLNGSVFENSKFLRFEGYSKEGVPVFYCELSRLANYVLLRDDDKVQISLLQAIFKDLDGKDQLLKYLFNFLEEKRREGILTDKMVIVLDRGTTKEPSLSLCRYLIPIFQKHFPNRLAKMYVFPVSGASAWMSWSAIKVTFEKPTLQKVVLSDSNAILKDIMESKSTLELIHEPAPLDVHTQPTETTSTDPAECDTSPHLFTSPLVPTTEEQVEPLSAAAESAALNKSGGARFWSRFRQASVRSKSVDKTGIPDAPSLQPNVESIPEILWVAPDDVFPE